MNTAIGAGPAMPVAIDLEQQAKQERIWAQTRRARGMLETIESVGTPEDMQLAIKALKPIVIEALKRV